MGEFSTQLEREKSDFANMLREISNTAAKARKIYIEEDPKGTEVISLISLLMALKYLHSASEDVYKQVITSLGKTIVTDLTKDPKNQGALRLKTLLDAMDIHIRVVGDDVPNELAVSKEDLEFMKTGNVDYGGAIKGFKEPRSSSKPFNIDDFIKDVQKKAAEHKPTEH